MATILQAHERWKKIADERYLYPLALNELKKFKDDLIKINKEQLSEGESSDGNVFGVYKPATQEFARTVEPGPREDKIAGTRYNFEWTGGLFDGFYVEVTNEFLKLYSSDSKVPVLEEAYPGLFGIQDEKLEELILAKVLPSVLVLLRKELGL